MGESFSKRTVVSSPVKASETFSLHSTPQVFVDYGEGRAADAAVEAHAPGHAAHEGGLARAQLAVHGDDRTVRYFRGEGRAGVLGFAFRMRYNLHE